MRINDERKARDLIRSGTGIAGAAIGGALGFYAGGPGSAAALGAAGTAVTQVLAHIADRYMTDREKSRVGAVAAIALDRISDRAKSGQISRSDIFDSQAGEEPPGAELLEGALFKARGEYENKKLPFIAYFYANLVFEPNVPLAVAFMLIKAFERLTYRQLILLAIIADCGTLDVSFLRERNHDNLDIEALKREEMDLQSSDLGTMGLVTGTSPYTDKLNSLGETFAALSGLSAANAADQAAVLRLIQAPG